MNLRKDHHRFVKNITVRKRLGRVPSPSNNPVNLTNQKGGGCQGVLKWVDGHIDLEVEISLHFAIARPLEFCFYKLLPFNFVVSKGYCNA